MKNRKTKIRTRILIVISIILIFSFALIGVIFNIAARQYIQSNAVSQLDKSYDDLLSMMEQAEAFITTFPDDREQRLFLRGNNFRIEANMFVVDKNCDPIDNLNITAEILEIVQAVKDKSIEINGLRNERINTAEGVYYASAFGVADVRMERNVYWFIYADVTGLSQFANTVNFFFVVLVCIMFVVVFFVTFFLSSSITRPIHKLSSFASNIGRGDFTPNDYVFREMEFEDLNQALNKTAKQLGIYDSEQKAFFQNVSHELRTPIMSIQCYAEGISVGLMEPKKASDTILLEVERLNDMVKDLLYISKLDNITSAYTAAKVDVIEIIRDCASRQQAVADKSQVSFSFDFDELPIVYECVVELISRAIDNLISNALRYASSEIALSCHTRDNQIEICITDDGPGIENEAIPHIFERFYKGSDGNHGIGLSIVKAIIDQHRGRIKAGNTGKGGAVFTIMLPATARR